MADDRLNFGRGDVVSRKYEIEAHLSDGIYGKTYLGRHISSGQHVVLKFIRPELLPTADSLERFKKAFAKVKAVRHAALVRLGEINEHHSLTYVTEEYSKSQSLREVLQEAQVQGKPFSLQDACGMVIKVLEALQVGHQSGLIHRNLRPECIQVTTQATGPGGSRLVRTIRVAEMGLLDMLGGDGFGDRYDSGYDTTYLAPELAGFGSEGSPQADVYSVGVILYELLCGQVPKGTFLSPTQIRDDLPPHIDKTVELALSPDPGDRYPSARDMVNDIQRSFNLESQVEGGGTSTRTVVLAAGLGLALVGALAVWAFANPPVDPVKVAEESDKVLRIKLQQENPPPAQDVLQTYLKAKPEMVYVPGGTFVRGRLNAEDTQRAAPTEPLAEVVEVQAFLIDRFEFPNREGETPVGNVTWKDAEKACTDLGKRLCTADEWEKACKGPENLVYAYGDTWDSSFCGTKMDDPYKTGERANCHSGYGVYDQSGGSREWTSTPHKTKKGRYSVKGGLSGNAEKGSRCAFSEDVDGEYGDGNLTFRCCLDPSLALNKVEPPAPPAQ